MTPQFGDIVKITARHDEVPWIVSPSGSYSPGSVPNVRLLRHNAAGNWSSHTVRITEVTVIERPEFQIGEKVSIGGRPATIIAVDADTARIRYEPRSVPLGRSGYTRRDEGGQTTIPHWRLALDNRLQGAIT